MCLSRFRLFALLTSLAVALSAAPAAETFLRGCDVSALAKAESLGARFAPAEGPPADPLAILSSHGVDTLRLRVWVASPDGWHDADAIVPIAVRARALGLRLLLTFHYSDTWADPAHQTKPAAWRDLGPDALADAVREHTRSVCAALVAAGAPADFVQIGNEINDGLLWPDGRISAHRDDFSRVARLLRAGIEGARAAHPPTRVALHLGDAVDENLIRWWFDGVRAAGVEWDFTGLSYYPHLHGPPARLKESLARVAARYGKPVLVLETAHPFTLRNADTQPNLVGRREQLRSGHDATPAGQAAFLREVIDAVRAVPGGLGAGVFWWEATWTPQPGNGWDNRDPRSANNWENQALFDFHGRALPALREFAAP